MAGDEISNFKSFIYNIKQGIFINNDYESEGWKFILQKQSVCLYVLFEEGEEQGFLSIRHSILVDEDLNLKVVSMGRELKVKNEDRKLETYSQLKELMQRLDNMDAHLPVQSYESTRLEKLEIEYVEEEHTNSFRETTTCEDRQSIVTCGYSEIVAEELMHCNEVTDELESNRESVKSVEIEDTRKTTTKNYQCSICNKSFKKSSTLRDHQNVHTNQKPYSCNICSRVFSFETSLISHIKLHENVKDYKCSYCSKMFARRRNMLCHERLVHVKEKPFMCSICGKTCTDSTCFKKHIANHQNPQRTESTVLTKTVPAQPKIPKTKLEKPISLKVGEKKPRQRRNTGSKKHKCDLCDKMFARRRNVLHHMSYTHNKVKPHECQFCGKRYSDITSFKRHIRGHTDPAELEATQISATDYDHFIDDENLNDFSTIELQSGLADEALTFIVIAES